MTTTIRGTDNTAASPAITGTDTDTGIFFPAADTIAFSEGGTEAARFDSSGNFMQGTTSWGYSGNKGIQVRASGSDNSSLFLETASATIKGFMASDPTASRVGLGSLSNHPLVFIANDAERARIDSSGNVLVNATAQIAQGKFGVAFVGSTNQAASFNETSGAASWTTVLFQRLGTTIGSISNATSSTAYNTSSDYRLKNTIAPMTGALAKVQALKPVTYKWNIDDEVGEGFIAHELAEVCPHAVTGTKDAVDADGNPVYQGIDTSFLVATLTAAIQEQQQMIETLQAKVAALEAKG